MFICCSTYHAPYAKCLIFLYTTNWFNVELLTAPVSFNFKMYCAQLKMQKCKPELLQVHRGAAIECAMECFSNGEWCRSFNWLEKENACQLFNQESIWHDASYDPALGSGGIMTVKV